VLLQDPGNPTGAGFTTATQDVEVVSGTTVPLTIYL
jgi:hypothetical protein